MGLSKKPALRHRQMHGLLIVAAVFWINLFVLGFFRAGGVLYVAMVRTFECSYEKASWPFSLAGATLCMTGPFASALSRLLSIRLIVTIGALITSVAISCCFFADEIVTVVILLGILYGIGTGLICNLTPLLLTQCFEKHRAIACGVAYSGSTIGSFFWPALLEYLIHQYGLRGSLLIYGAIILHGVLGAILLRPFAKVPQAEADAPKCAQESDRDVLEPLQKCQSVDFQPMHNGSSNLPPQFTGRRISSHASLASATEETDNLSTCAISVSNMCMVLSDGDRRFSRDEQTGPVLKKKCTSLSSCDKLRGSSGFLHSRRSSAETAVHEGSVVAQAQEKEVPENDNGAVSWCSTVIRVVQRDLQLLRNQYFIFVTISAVGFFFVFSTFIIIIPDYATDQGLTPSDGVFLLSVYGISDLLSKPIPGLLAYNNLLSNKGIFISGGFITGLIMLVMPFMHSYWSFVVMTLLFGLMTGGLIFMSPVLLTEFLGPQLAVMAFGLSNLFIGLASLMRPFIIGYFKDNWNSYNGLFYTMAGACIFSSLIWFVDPILTKMQTRRNEKADCEKPQAV